MGFSRQLQVGSTIKWGSFMAQEILPKLREVYSNAILAGESERVCKLIDQGLANGVVPSKLYLEVVMSVWREIEALWQRGQITILQERIATQIMLRQMGRLREMLKARRKLGLKALVSAVVGDQHLVNAQAVADLLMVDGWEVDFLGADVPTDHLVAYSKARGANLVYISATLAEHFPAVQHLVAQLRMIEAAPKILIGGAAFAAHPAKAAIIKVDGFSNDPQEIVMMARQVCGVLTAENALALFLIKLGHSVHDYRKLRGLSQQELAGSADLDRAYISAVEHGKQNISIGAISKLAKALNLSIEELLLGIES